MTIPEGLGALTDQPCDETHPPVAGERAGELSTLSPSPIPVPKKRAPKARPEDTELPAALATDAFRRAWSDWIGYRRDRRLTLTARTLSQQLKALAAMGESGAIASIEASIKNGWQGLFGPHKGTAKNARSRYADGPGQVHRDSRRVLG